MNPDDPDTIPTQEGPCGIRFDFNDGARIFFPAGDQWRVDIWDLDTKTLIYRHVLQGGTVQTRKRYFVRFAVDIWKNDEHIFRHEFDLTGQIVAIKMGQGGLGDHLAWIEHVEFFRRRHQCRVFCQIRPDLLALFRESYPEIEFRPGNVRMEEPFYASYKVLVFYNDEGLDHSPVDYREAGLALSAPYILGLPLIERRPSLSIPPSVRPIAEPYVCLATQASSHCKYWNNPDGWIRLVQYLKNRGYRVICIDQKPVTGQGRVWHYMPHGAEDETGNRPLSERAMWLKHADFFVGLSSGLSWLAWAMETPVVMISGFTAERNEFSTPWRVINRHLCNSCSNDIRCQLDVSDYFWCPRHKDTPREFECSIGISAEQVVSVVEDCIQNAKNSAPAV
ncbi:glycosyltransferase [Acetobacter indonesiensis NRIC 0313]|uniref:Autotransporter strand-loop-strand O-heptosyltransferase n=1 Tax=Acetobacter indonesiensis TaxID=104101 RepID=A0A252AV42_9PROT|nr:autotransporter strand-loop-strand O-heptosyltransferase [Acetobacter indonesiensis]OUI94025.1 glycosyltransferase [Acetobacter indonesiensis]GAN62570.1 glycosyl transferase [Acetobacter indonesiensis]GBQ55719.1 glycosyltransferase [Acetobacter indonesiensis NRIC 0313]GEN04078.1 autotransporter strand-loop-strand O-heptosyltransferase [Acetobacter indonesiensis]